MTAGVSRWASIDASLRWSALAFGCALLLHADRLPLWCIGAVLALVAWRLASGTGRIAAPGTWIRNGIAIALLLAVGAYFGGVSGLAAGTALLAVMGALKLLETHTPRDHMVMIAVTLFLTAAACLDRQDLWRVPLYVGQIWLTCATLGVVATPAVPLARREAFRLAGRTLVFALPVALVAFVLFPRVQGQLWALPGAGSAITGLSNEMSPGAIGQLSESNEPAFRVRFAGTSPTPGELYWRGPVLHDFDGYTWRRDETRLRRAPLDYTGPAYTYRVTLEPHQQRWLLALDTPFGSPQPDIDFTADYQLLADRAVTQPISYEARSSTATRAREPLDAPARSQALRLPPGRNLRSIALARDMRSRAPDDARFVGDVLGLFGKGGFVYSLTPPKLDLNSVDDFLFNTRVGFCGHYASAFVTLMRAAGIPARIVTGYQGGEWNPLGGYLIVRQSDAHAWAEVWLTERGGWNRVDPTGMVAPDRLTRGFLGGLADAGARLGAASRDLGWAQRALLGWDAVNTWWKNRVIEFDLGSQLAMLGRLGFEDPGVEVLRILLLVGLLLWLGWIGLQFSRSRAAMPRTDALGQSYRRLCQRLERAGAPRRAAHQGPLAYRDAIAAFDPALGAQVAPLLEAYSALRFGAVAEAGEVEALRRAVVRLHPLRTRH